MQGTQWHEQHHPHKQRSRQLSREDSSNAPRKSSRDSLSASVADVSLLDLTCVLERPTTIDEIKAAVKLAAEEEFEGLVRYTDDPVVSSDFIGDPSSLIFDSAAAGVDVSPPGQAPRVVRQRVGVQLPRGGHDDAYVGGW